MNARLAREFYSWQHLGSMMWTILILGAVITICFMFFFGLENIRLQMVMTSLLTIYLTFMLYLVFTLDHIFEGAVQVTPRPFQESVAIFDRLDQQT
jgi:ABC-type branched-subunit amino acid transport system permease subunit